MPTIKTIKSCCGSSVKMVVFDKPIRKTHAILFKNAGYFIPDSFFQVGIFYAQLGSFIIQGSYGNTTLNINCSGQDCENKIKTFVDLAEQITNS